MVYDGSEGIDLLKDIKANEKKELEYFHVGNAFGGNQDWFTDHWMHIGGCAAATACDSCIQLEASQVKRELFPYEVHNLNRETYVKFAMRMKPYLRPRWSGIDRLEIYEDSMW